MKEKFDVLNVLFYSAAESSRTTFTNVDYGTIVQDKVNINKIFNLMSAFFRDLYVVEIVNNL